MVNEAVLVEQGWIQTLKPDRQKKLRDGQELFVSGLRAAAKQAGWHADHFNAMYAALSMHSHCAPTSFYRAAADPTEPAPGISPDYQYLTSGLALEYVTEALWPACKQMFAIYSELSEQHTTH